MGEAEHNTKLCCIGTSICNDSGKKLDICVRTETVKYETAVKQHEGQKMRKSENKQKENNK